MISFLIVFSLKFVGTSFAVTGNNFTIEDHLKYKINFSYHEGKSEKLNDGSAQFYGSDYSCVKDELKICLPWLHCDRTKEICNYNDTIHDYVRCNKSGYIDGILDCTCITYKPKDCKFQVGKCALNCEQHRTTDTQQDFPYHYIMPNVSDWSKNFCDKYNRTGTLCGKCKEGFHLLAYSFSLHCVQCHGGKSNWIKYILSAFLPLTLFCFIILLLNINVHSSHLQGYVILSQFASSTMLVRVGVLFGQRYPTLFRVFQFFGSFYGFWNLDFFRLFNPGICLQISTLTVASLDLLVALYPMGLMVVAYLMVKLYDRRLKLLLTLWKPFRSFLNLFHSHWDVKTSMIDAFSTFLFLSNLKLMNSFFDLLVPVKVYHFTSLEDIRYDYKLFYDSTIPLFGHEHLPYVLISIVLMLVFVFLPIFCLCLSQIHCFRKCSSALPYRWQIILHTMVDSFQGCYKDGTEPGTRDYRWFSGLVFIIRPIVYAISAVTLDAMLFPYVSMMFVVMAIIILICDPFKTKLAMHTTTLMSFVILMACGCVAAVGHIMTNQRKDIRRIFNIALALIYILPILYITVLILHWIFMNGRLFRFKWIRRVHHR